MRWGSIRYGYEELGGLWSTVISASSTGGGVVLMLGARAGDGISELSVGLAQLAAGRVPNAAWLVDLDLYGNRHIRALQADGVPLAGPFDMSFGHQPFWQVGPKLPGKPQRNDAIVGLRVDDSRLFVSQFNRAAVGEGQTVRLAPAPQYWDAVRARIDLTIIDAPPLEQSRAGLAMIKDADGVVLVVNGHGGDPSDSAEIRDEIVARGGRCLGVVVTKPSGPYRNTAKKRREAVGTG